MMAGDAPVALVTGARKGIGRGLSEHLVSRGYQVVGCSRRAADWQLDGFVHVEADVSKEPDVKQLFRFIHDEYGRLDAVVNNAAVASMNHVLLMPLDTVDGLLRTNVAGTFLVSREAAKLMRRRKFGRIVNISSAIVHRRTPGEAVYLASKRAVEYLAQVMAAELADFGITVNVVGPCLMRTDMLRGVPEKALDRILEDLPLKSMTTVADIANVVDFFLRPESSAVTAQVIYLGGVPSS
jgi:3-oxoacyl-[acyl-carrier protein] reductase